MKTTKMFSVLSLALIFLAATSGFAKNPDKTKAAGPAVSVRYEVNVHFNSERLLCNTYQVELLDVNGRMVAPAQYFEQGKVGYTFYEQTRQTAGVRIARLVMSPNVDRMACPQELFTAPDVKLISFTDHGTYTFDLTPSVNPSKIKD
jgi:hypothetical protein